MTRPAPPRSRVALACGAVGVALLGLPRPARAQPPVTIATPGLPGGDDFVSPSERLADWANYQRSGWQKMNRGWFDSAEREFLGGIRAARRAPDRTRTQLLSQSYASLAWALERQGKDRQAEPLARWVLEVWRSRYGETSHQAARAANLVATIDLALGKRSEAVALLRPILAVEPGQSAELRQEQDQGQSLLALILASDRRYAEAEVEYQRAVARREAARPRDDATLGDEYNNLAWCRIEQRKHKPARDAMDRALGLLKSSRGGDDPTVARALEGLARVDAEQDDLGAAEGKLRRAIEIYEVGGEPTRARAADALRRHAALLDRMKRPRDAEAARARATRLADPRPDPATPANLASPPAPRTPATMPPR